MSFVLVYDVSQNDATIYIDIFEEFDKLCRDETSRCADI
jgi:hypothetical protein